MARSRSHRSHDPIASVVRTRTSLLCDDVVPDAQRDYAHDRYHEELFCRTNLDLIDFGPSVRDKGAVLRNQYQIMRQKGFSPSLISQVRSQLIRAAQRCGKEAQWDMHALEQALRAASCL